jgi:hypothetical protein
MKKSSRTQQSAFTKNVIKVAKQMVDNNKDSKEVFAYIESEYKKEAENHLGIIDNIQYQKAIKSVIDYM